VRNCIPALTAYVIAVCLSTLALMLVVDALGWSDHDGISYDALGFAVVISVFIIGPLVAAVVLLLTQRRLSRRRGARLS
jgi:hypothetical protein